MARFVLAVILSVSGVGARQLNFRDVGVYATDFDFCTFTCYKITPSDDGYDVWAQRLRKAHEAGKFNLVSLYCFDRVSHSRPIEEYCETATAMLEALDPETVDAICLSEENVTWNNGLEVLNRLYDHVKSIYPGPVYQWLTFPDTPHPKLKADGWVYDAYGQRYLDFRRYVVKYLITGKPLIMCVNASPDVNDLTVTTEQVMVCREFNLPVMYFAVDWDVGSPNHWLLLDKDELAEWRDRIWALVELSQSADVAAAANWRVDLSPGSGVEVIGDDTGEIDWGLSFGDQSFLDRATIRGLPRLEWDGAGETLNLVRPGEASLTLHIRSMLPMEQPRADADCTLVGDAACDVLLSADGREFLPAEQAGELTGRHLWLRVRLSAEGAESSVSLRHIALHGRNRVPDERAIRLVPGGSVDQLKRVFVRYEDNFEAPRHRLLGHVDNAEELIVTPGQLAIRGREGNVNSVTIRQRFVCDQPLGAIKVSLGCGAWERDLGAHNELALSLDGETVLLGDSTSGRAGENGRFEGRLEIDASDDERFRGVRLFWVHMTMVNGSGVETNPSNFLRRLEVSATAAPADL